MSGYTECLVGKRRTRRKEEVFIGLRPPLVNETCLKWGEDRGCQLLDTERELNTDIDVAGDLDEFGELDGLLGGVLEVVDSEDLEARLVDLFHLH